MQERNISAAYQKYTDLLRGKQDKENRMTFR